ncbi:immunity 41 family protein [Granulicatella adiacens]|uniref:immunity 41 family protein n=1 Tax=Granulicatella adiacens TaxID=46124 RepID=UPI0021A96262|nr:immunity 41 family protein [Granulicatella adiacens]MCT2161287.1 immunity 41 family protein [Granulicatella adiacens]
MSFIRKNVLLEEGTFFYYLHEESLFHEESYKELCAHIEGLESISLEDFKDLVFLHHQVIRHLVYHFDPVDIVELKNFPTDYWEVIERIDIAVKRITLKVKC